MPDGRMPEPGGWNRFSLEVSDLTHLAASLRGKGVPGPQRHCHWCRARQQVLIEDPSGNPMELFEPSLPDAMRPRPVSVDLAYAGALTCGAPE